MSTGTDDVPMIAEVEVGEDLEPPRNPPRWSDPIDGAELLDLLTGTFRNYLSLTDGAPEIMALWTVYTYALDACQIAPRLLFKSPVPNCGKTTALSLLASLCANPLMSGNITGASVFRQNPHDGPDADHR
jgi:hypothetical protein